MGKPTLDDIMRDAGPIVASHFALIDALPPRLSVVSVKGLDVTLAFTEPVPASERGTLLMDAEDALQSVLPGAVVWHEPLGDRNSLRNLRGIEVKG